MPALPADSTSGRAGGNEQKSRTALLAPSQRQSRTAHVRPALDTSVDSTFASPAAAQREPVRVMRRDRAVDITVLAQDCEAMRELFANRLKHTLLEPAPLTSLQIISAQQAYAVLGI